MAKALIVGNWKMNLDYPRVDNLMDGIVDQLSEGTLARADVAVCPSFIFLPRVLERAASTEVSIGAQDCAGAESGAYTGQVSASMLAECGCAYVIVGHSERRQYNGETNEAVRAKAQAALDKDLTPIICVGETLSQRESGDAYKVVSQQLEESLPANNSIDSADIVIAYEPVWAIGTGAVASVDDVQQMHAHIYSALGARYGAEVAGDLRILYGGSMKPDNAADILAVDHVHGGLIGGASLDAESFLAIASCA